GWLNLKVMLVYTPDSFLLKPGAALAVTGLALSCSLAAGPLMIAGIGFNLYWMLLGVTLATLGYSCIQIGIVARIMHRLRPGIAEKVQRLLTYDRGMILAGICVFAGIVCLIPLVVEYVRGGGRL